MALSARELEHLFFASLSLASAACSASAEPPVERPDPPADTSKPVVSSKPSPPVADASAPPVPTSRPDDSTPGGYALGFRSAGPYEFALTGLQLLGFADVGDGGLQCEGGKRCPEEWQTLVDDTFSRAAIVRKSRTLAKITEANFSEWVGPVDGPERAALRVRVEAYRTTATCAQFAEQGYACAPGSHAEGVPVRAVEDGFEVATFGERDVCEGGKYGYATVLGVVHVSREGDVNEVSNVFTKEIDAKAEKTTTCHYAVKGRRFEGYVDEAIEAERREADYHARAEREEAAAAIAFDRLAAELAAHGAPDALVAEAREAAEDERRHAALFRRARVGASARSTAGPSSSEREAPLLPVRDLLAVLLENAREGCANEAYAAVVATHQSLRAPRRMRGVFERVASDERRHARFAHAVHAWGIGRVNPDERARLERELDAAVDALVAHGASSPAGLALGEPDPRVARAAFAHVVSGLRVGATSA
ncbi:MAG: hypothetical protein U0414_33785 [Polyangiaceae bacterium]